jgi:hypothetical protein
LHSHIRQAVFASALWKILSAFAQSDRGDLSLLTAGPEEELKSAHGNSWLFNPAGLLKSRDQACSNSVTRRSSVLMFDAGFPPRLPLEKQAELPFTKSVGALLKEFEVFITFEFFIATQNYRNLGARSIWKNRTQCQRKQEGAISRIAAASTDMSAQDSDRTKRFDGLLRRHASIVRKSQAF